MTQEPASCLQLQLLGLLRLQAPFSLSSYARVTEQTSKAVPNNTAANVAVLTICCANVCDIKRNSLTATRILKGEVGSQEKRPDLVIRNHEKDTGAMLA